MGVGQLTLSKTAFQPGLHGNPPPRGRLLPRGSHESDENEWLISFGARLALIVGVIDLVTNQIEHYMDLLSARQKLVASNIANVDTPGYKSKDIDFQFEFISLAQDAPPNVVEPQGLVVKNDGNNVSMDREARLLSENALRFNLATTLMRSQLKTVNNAIQEKTG